MLQGVIQGFKGIRGNYFENWNLNGQSTMCNYAVAEFCALSCRSGDEDAFVREGLGGHEHHHCKPLRLGKSRSFAPLKKTAPLRMTVLISNSSNSQQNRFYAEAATLCGSACGGLGGGFEQLRRAGFHEFVGDQLTEGERAHVGAAGFVMGADCSAGCRVGDYAEDLLPLA